MMLYNTKNPHGGDIYTKKVILDYSANINPFGTPENVINTMKNSLSDVLHYPDPYCRELVSAISEFENINREYILCGNGAADLIFSYCLSIKPRCAIEIAPCFSEYSKALNLVNCDIKRYEINQENNFEIREDFLDFVDNVSPDAIFLCNPNNPTGRLIPSEILEKILILCEQRKIYLFLDECFMDLSEDGESMKKYLKNYSMLFILKAFTKSFGLAGIRLGYCLCGNDKILSKMSECTQAWNVSLIAQNAGVTALKEIDFLEKSREIIFNERKWLKSELEALRMYVCPSVANYLLFKSIIDLDNMLMEYGIKIRNCDNYHGLGKGWYRIAIKTHDDNQILINSIKTILGGI